MGVTCILVVLDHDHERGVVRATAALAAARLGDLEPMRSSCELLAAPRDVDERLVAERRPRLKTLEDLNAQEAIVALERRSLEETTGSGRNPADADRADRDAFEGRLRRWSRQTHTDIDKSWDLIHWLTDAGRRSRTDGQCRESLVARRRSRAGCPR